MNWLYLRLCWLSGRYLNRYLDPTRPGIAWRIVKYFVIPHSLKKRFAFKLIGNLAALVLGVVALAVVPRALGPSDYGRFEFLAANFALILGTMTLQLPTAYFNWISRKGHKENTDYASGLTFYWSIGIIALFGMLIYTAVQFGINGLLWPDVQPIYLWLALAFSSVVLLYQLCANLADGRALTVGNEIIRLLLNCFKTGGVLIFFGWGILTLTTYFSIQIGVVASSVIISLVWLSSRGAVSFKALKCWSIDARDKARFHAFSLSYGKPLMMAMFVGFAYTYFDRWFLQIVGGSSQQGYFSLSDRLGTVVFIFTSAMTPLLTREFAYAYEKGDLPRLKSLFERIRIFLFIAAVIGCFISVQSEAVVKLFGGGQYLAAIIPVAIMALYPIHQTFGQLSGALLIATGQTKLYAKLAIAVMLLSAPVSYLLLAPSTFALPGLGLGATGLALKMVIVQFIGTNIQLYFNTKYLGVSFSKWMLLQAKVIGAIYAFAAVSHLVTRNISDAFIALLNVFRVSPDLFNLLSRLSLSALIYAAMIVLFLVCFPNLIGIGRINIKEFLLGTQ